MKIELDREKKIILLLALKEGYIDDYIISDWISIKNMTMEEIEAEMECLERLLHPDGCNRFKRMGLCQYGNKTT